MHQTQLVNQYSLKFISIFAREGLIECKNIGVNSVLKYALTKCLIFMKAKYLFFQIIVVFLVNATFAQESLQNRKYDFPRRNSVYLQNLLIFPTLYYDRVIPISDHFGIIPKLGILHGLGYGNSLLFEPSVFIGGNKHYGEFGVGMWLDQSGSVPIIINYRYMGKRGLLTKVGYRFADIYKNSLFVGIGYSF